MYRGCRGRVRAKRVVGLLIMAKVAEGGKGGDMGVGEEKKRRDYEYVI